MIHELSPAQAASALPSYRVIDVREPDEWSGPLGHIGAAELVPLATVVQAAAGWDRAQPLLVVCKSGGRSGRACGALAQMGFQSVTNLAGGMMAWNDAGLPVTR